MTEKSGKPFFPLYVDLSDKKVVVVGAGTIAKRRIRILTAFTSDLTVIAPEVNKELLFLEEQGMVKILRKRYEKEDLAGADIVLAASSDTRMNNDVYNACKSLGITVNVCSDRTKCDFFFPGILQKDTIAVGIHSQGKDHKEAKKLMTQIAQMLEVDDMDDEQ